MTLQCLLLILCLLIVGPVYRGIISSDKSLIWSPIIFWGLYLVVYVIKPTYEYIPEMGGDVEERYILYILGAIVSYISIYLGYSLKIRRTAIFHSFNSVFNNINLTKVSIILFLIAFCCYGIFNGFSINIFNATPEIKDFDENGSYNHPEAYLTSLISLFALSGCTALSVCKKKQKKFWLLLVITMIALSIYLVGGFRYRILIFVVALASFAYLYPRPKRINYLIIIPLVAVLYIGMGVIEMTRSYGQGLNLNAIEDQSLLDIKASETYLVSDFSSEVMSRYTTSDFIYFEPIVTAICMPIPRAVFPWKPNGYYMREANIKVYNTITMGNAFVYFVEAYISFGWIGIILQGLFIGWICKLFWINYKLNPYSIGAISLLAIFNGVCFVWVSRGYFAQVFQIIMYYLVIPYWITILLSHFSFFRRN